MAAQDPGAPPLETTPQSWLTPATLSYVPSGVPEPPASAAMFELRPLNLSEALDRTFALYRSRFWLFAGISVFSGAVQALVTSGQMLTQSRMMRSIGQISAGGPQSVVTPQIMDFVGPLLTLVGTLLFFLAYSVTTAATVYAVGEVYLGRPATVADSFRATIKRWYRYIAIATWQAFSFAWVPVAILVPAFVLAVRAPSLAWLGALLAVLGGLGGFAGGYILYLRNMLAVPACVTERLKIRPSMRRSKVLSPGSKTRLFVLHLITFALYMVVGVLQAPFSMIALFSMMKLHGATPYVLQAIAVVIGFFGHTVVAPVLAIGITLVYFDQRVRIEAFDIALLLGEDQGMEASASAGNGASDFIGPITPAVPLVPGNQVQAGDAPLL